MLPDYLTSAVRLFAKENAVFFASASVLFFTTTLVLGAAWLRSRLRPQRSAAMAPSLTSEAQLAQMAQAIDAIAIEVERVGEAQRYAARGAVDRIGAQRERAPSRTPTPH